MRSIFFYLALLCLFISSKSFSAFNSANNPENMDLEYKAKFSELPLKGSLTKRPWSGDYWSTYKGGTTYRWGAKTQIESDKWNYKLPVMSELKDENIRHLSPAEKYDLFLGNTDFDYTNYERERTGITKTFPWSENYDSEHKIPLWEGLCHAWAPATLVYDNPRSVVMTGALGHTIEFGASDIKALLSGFVDFNFSKIESVGIGSRCNFSFKELEKKYKAGEITKEEYLSKINSSECSDTNAGAFHVVLTNQIALKDEGFVIDITRDAEVWNQAVYSFESKVHEELSGVSAEATPGTIKEILVHTNMTYIVEVPQAWNNKITNKSLKKAIYKYILELNADGEIIGGRWMTHERPDFVYKQVNNPEFSGYFEELGKIYKRATGEAKPEVARAGWSRVRRKFFKKKRAEEFIKAAKIAVLKRKMKKAVRGSVFKRIFIKKVKNALLVKKLKKKAKMAAINSAFTTEITLLAKKRSETTSKLIAAVRDRKVKDMMKYLDLGAKGNGNHGENGNEELINAIIYKGHNNLVKKFIVNGATLNTVLIKAVKVADMAIFKTFVSSGANVNYIDEENKVTPLLRAAHKGNLEMVKILLKAGAAESVNYIGFRKRNALSFAITGTGKGMNKDRLEIVKLLLEAGVKTNIKDERGKTSFDHAREKGNRLKRKLLKLLNKYNR